ncbi:hypothetical protein PGQ11_013227 [Apiospora arundinis]|uniref:Uncharacterized protein n=1 Tax=Apiospora arundinis TaxID=335852 RepID=A0ABR2I7C4_9PEZI
MHLAAALPLLLAAAPATLMASPMHQQQEEQSQAVEGPNHHHHHHQQQDKENQPIVIGVDHRVKTSSSSVNGHNHGGKSMDKDKAKNKRHHVKLDVFFGHVLHPDCAAKEKKCKNCGDDLNCAENPDCEWCFACVWTTAPDVSYYNSTMSRV